MIAEQFLEIQAQIKQAIADAADPAHQVHLIAVSKQQPEEKIKAALATGHRLFGENRVQEAQERWQKRRADYPDLKLHLIGPLQSNKAADAVALFDVIETIDREKIAKAVAKEIAKQDKEMSCFVQVNTGREPQKSGIDATELNDFVAYCQTELGLNITGLMCIPPADEEAAMHFALLKKYARDLNLPHLSMGMSADFAEAISFGADYVRVGSALFGTRLPRS